MDMTELLFDTPWWLPVGIAALGVIVFVSGNRRRETRVRAAGGVLVLLAAVLFGVSYYMDTPTERAERQARELVRAVVGRDWRTVTSLLDPRASVAIINGKLPIYTNRDQIIAGATNAAERYDFKTATITSLDARRDDTVITVTVNILSDQGATMGYRLPTEWQLEWQETANGWSLIRITCLRIGQASGEATRQQFPAP
jgi:hypothetical protein